MQKFFDSYLFWLALAGIMLVLGAFFWYEDIRQAIAMYSFSPGTVVDFEQSVIAEGESLRPVIHFLSYTGEMVELILANNDRGLVEGGTVDVMYPTTTPLSANIYSEYILWGGPTLILLTGMTILLVVFVIAAKDDALENHGEAMKDNKIDDKTQHTIALNTLFVNVEKNRGAEVDGQLPYCIYTQWRDPITSEIHFFQSKNLWLDPTKHIKKKKLTVFIDQEDRHQYDVDLSFLPEEVVMENSRLSEQFAAKSL